MFIHDHSSIPVLVLRKNGRITAQSFALVWRFLTVTLELLSGIHSLQMKLRLMLCTWCQRELLAVKLNKTRSRKVTSVRRLTVKALRETRSGLSCRMVWSAWVLGLGLVTEGFSVPPAGTSHLVKCHVRNIYGVSCKVRVESSAWGMVFVCFASLNEAASPLAIAAGSMLARNLKKIPLGYADILAGMFISCVSEPCIGRELQGTKAGDSCECAAQPILHRSGFLSCFEGRAWARACSQQSYSVIGAALCAIRGVGVTQALHVTGVKPEGYVSLTGTMQQLGTF
ncbi:hypothetical protein Anapl_13661 [Anas platyrhynchos]|uniref:Uncharacterized protein n=1 Tax=Anas platyrhynchos TaxID=8839 RepID=R0K609_ANAPL|nr:hypothetical protein Anapl_13661 [Anas platyrhynchos]